MKFGAALPYTNAREIADLAALAEEHGWDGAFVGDAIWTVDPIVSLTAAALRTQRIRLGVMVVPVPLRKPWKIASEAAALDNLSGGRMTLALATGATWMGWHAFPDEVTDTRQRAEMLDETIDILARLFAGQPFDYDGRHYRVKLTALDPQYYPQRPVQQPVSYTHLTLPTN
jgi:alkanesulfonate monooxygenase SsuD/methylene tetrahydromethanopterin reductase-like flavin-dependent oxidoreductase (luciferase family)